MGWFAERAGERATASVPTGQWNQGELVYEISLAEFDRLKLVPGAFHAIHRRHNEVRGDGWVVQRDDKCVAFLDRARFADNRRFAIPNEAFERLRADPTLFDEIHRAHGADYV